MQFQASSGNSVPLLNLTGLTYFRIRKINKQFNRILFLLTLYQCSGMNCLMISEVLLVWKFLRNPMHIAILIDKPYTCLILIFYLYIYFSHFLHLSVFIIIIFCLLYIYFYLSLALPLYAFYTVFYIFLPSLDVFLCRPYLL